MKDSWEARRAQQVRDEVRVTTVVFLLTATFAGIAWGAADAHFRAAEARFQLDACQRELEAK